MRIYTRGDGIKRAKGLRKYVNQNRDKCKKYRTPKIYDRSKIASLLKQGLSLNQVAKQVGCSTAPVQAVKKELNLSQFDMW